MRISVIISMLVILSSCQEPQNNKRDKFKHVSKDYTTTIKKYDAG